MIPKRFPKQQIPRILQQHEEWITTQLQKHQHSLEPAGLPQRIEVAFTNTEYAVNYKASTKKVLREKNGQLHVTHAGDCQAIELLRGWLRRKAKQLLVPGLAEVASELGFDYNKCIIRTQKSRWGSCSSSGTISLNDQLLFLPAQTVRYLMIHELCHTRHMNHSTQFWQLVEQCCHDYASHEELLAQRKMWVPDWFLQDLYRG